MLWISQTAKYQNSSIISYHQHLANLATMVQEQQYFDDADLQGQYCYSVD